MRNPARRTPARFFILISCVVAMGLGGCATGGMGSQDLTLQQRMETFYELCKSRGLVEANRVAAAVSRLTDLLLSGRSEDPDKPQDTVQAYLERKGETPTLQARGVHTDAQMMTEAARAVVQASADTPLGAEDQNQLKAVISSSQKAGATLQKAVMYLQPRLSPDAAQQLDEAVNLYMFEAEKLQKISSTGV